MRPLKALYLNNRLFAIIVGLVFLFVFGVLVPFVFVVAKALLVLLATLVVLDAAMLFRVQVGIDGARQVPDKLSNGDHNPITIQLASRYGYPVWLRVIDELPEQFQKRDMDFRLALPAKGSKSIRYEVRPTKRGEYGFGAVNVFVSTQLGLVSRRYRLSANVVVPVYPSYLQMRQYELLAISRHLTELGIKKVRKISQSIEFEQVKEYVPGDDFRKINWKATARSGTLMANNYQDEKSQQVYSVIDKGRVMRMPFEGMSLLDYAINASLVISNIAIKKEDKAGLATFQHKFGTILPASKRNSQMRLILETLYNQKTAFKESDFSVLYAHIKKKIPQRSLLLLYTNFESLAAMRRQLPFLRMLAKDHLLVTIFFENTTLGSLVEDPARTIRQIYHKTIAEKFYHEKKQIVRELTRHGINAMLTPPDKLTVNTINKYLALKARGLI